MSERPDGVGDRAVRRKPGRSASAARGSGARCALASGDEVIVADNRPATPAARPGAGARVPDGCA